MNTYLFIYNAYSGLGHKVLDVAHKLFRPETYACNLCAITYDTFSENNIWKTFRKQNSISMRFLHSDEFEGQYPQTLYKYPVVLKLNQEELKVFLNADRINALQTVEELIQALEKDQT